MDGLTLHQLQCFDAVVTENGFQAAAARLQRSHSTVFAAVRNLESQLGLRLLDRDGYRVGLTEAGRSFHARTRLFLGEFAQLRRHADQLAIGEETELRIVIGDLCPVPETLRLLRRFFDAWPATRPQLHFEALAGPWERLFDDEADLILHHIDQADLRLAFTELAAISLIPVAAPGFLPVPPGSDITLEQLRGVAQCVLRDTARHLAAPSYFLVEGVRRWAVGDQLTKKEIILQGMGWGHLPGFLVAQELRDGRLVSLAGQHLRRHRAELVAARRRDRPHGPVADSLWRFLAEERGTFAATAKALDAAP
jgi:DNA-binding transcriptional LysR family regulator